MTPSPLSCTGSPGGTHANQTVLNISQFLTDLERECIGCPAGTSCSVGSAEPFDCLPGSFGATSRMERCDLCPAGKFTSDTRRTACDECTSGYICAEGSSTPVPCMGGTHVNQTVLNLVGFLSSLDECVACGVGTFCPVGSSEATPCQPGSFNPMEGQRTCGACEAGKYQSGLGATACIDCTRGSYCPPGAATGLPWSAPALALSLAMHVLAAWATLSPLSHLYR